VLGGASAEAVYVFLGAKDLSGTVVTSAADVTITGGPGFGFAMAGADRDGDGVTDLLVGEVDGVTRQYLTSWYSVWWPGDGLAWLFDGAAIGAGEVSSTDDSAGEATNTSARLLGGTVALGDLDGDGDIDAAVGAARASSRLGGIYVVR
jgi:hypothetical protein